MSRFNFRKSKTTTPETTPEVAKTPDELLQDSIKEHKNRSFAYRIGQVTFNSCAVAVGLGVYDVVSKVIDKDKQTLIDSLGLSFLGAVGATSLGLAAYFGSNARIEENTTSELTAQSELNNINAQATPARLPSTNPLELDI